MRNLIPAIAAFALLASVAAAAPAAAPADAPVRIEVFPAAATLPTREARVRLVVTGHYADGSTRDLTAEAAVEPADGSVVKARGAALSPAADGKTTVTVRAGGKTATLDVAVTGADRPEPVSFLYGALPALAKNGCSTGGCHGSPSGKCGFSLSMLGYDPEFDKLHLVRGGWNRRVNLMEPEKSLLLRKPLMLVSHGGGKRLDKADAAYAALLRWIGEGCRFDPPTTPGLVSLEVFPPTNRVLRRPAWRQQFGVIAKFADGTARDVTDLASYMTSDESVATVGFDGVVIGKGRGPVAVTVRFLDEVVTRQMMFVEDVPGFRWPDHAGKPVGYVDEMVDAQLRRLCIPPSPTCSDAAFVRRVYLDVIGLLPTPEETRAFLADKAPDKRAKLIDALLERPEHARFWGQRQADLLRVSPKRLGDPGAKAFADWIAESVAKDEPYDRFVAGLLTAEGSTAANPAANFWRGFEDTNTVTEAVAQLFLGVRITCAKCHNHPFERWTQDDYYGLAANFNRVLRRLEEPKDEGPDAKDPKDPKAKGSAKPKKRDRNADRNLAMNITVAKGGELRHPRTGQVMRPALPLTGANPAPAAEDARREFAKWLTAPANPFFAKVAVNRLWAHVMGRGIVEPVDDFRESNPPANAPLLDALAADFAKHGFDRRHILRVILNSNAYQRSIDRIPGPAGNADDDKQFSAARLRLLSAEQLLDAVGSVTGLPDKVPATQAALPPHSPFMTAFGQPARETACQCERLGDPSLEQALQLLNGPTVMGKVQSGGKDGRLRRLIAAKRGDREIVEELYLAAFSRPPTEPEASRAVGYVSSAADRTKAFEDLLWALLNTKEFAFQH
jgi:hypothetical protein